MCDDLFMKVKLDWFMEEKFEKSEFMRREVKAKIRHWAFSSLLSWWQHVSGTVSHGKLPGKVSWPGYLVMSGDLCWKQNTKL